MHGAPQDEGLGNEPDFDERVECIDSPLVNRNSQMAVDLWPIVTGAVLRHVAHTRLEQNFDVLRYKFLLLCECMCGGLRTPYSQGKPRKN